MFVPWKEVPDPELCKYLKKLGYPQKGGGWYWDIALSGRLFLILDRKTHYLAWDGKHRADILDKNDEFYETFVKAPTASELEEWLPPKISYPYRNSPSRCYLIAWRTAEGWFCGYIPHNCTLEEFKAVQVTGEDWRVKAWGETRANAYARMVIWLKNNGYISFDRLRCREQKRK